MRQEVPPQAENVTLSINGIVEGLFGKSGNRVAPPVSQPPKHPLLPGLDDQEDEASSDASPSHAVQNLLEVLGMRPARAFHELVEKVSPKGIHWIVGSARIVQEHQE